MYDLIILTRPSGLQALFVISVITFDSYHFPHSNCNRVILITPWWVFNPNKMMLAFIQLVSLSTRNIVWCVWTTPDNAFDAKYCKGCQFIIDSEVIASFSALSHLLSRLQYMHTTPVISNCCILTMYKNPFKMIGFDPTIVFPGIEVMKRWNALILARVDYHCAHYMTCRLVERRLKPSRMLSINHQDVNMISVEGIYKMFSFWDMACVHVATIWLLSLLLECWWKPTLEFNT